MDLRMELQAYIDKNKTTRSAIARALGCSPAVITGFFNGNYKGDVEGLEAKITQFLQVKEEKAEFPKADIGFVMTSVAEDVFFLARNCHVSGKIGVLCGESGVGKTTSVKEYARKNADVVVIYGRKTLRMKALFRELAQKCGVDPTGSVDDLFLRLSSRLKDSGMLIIIDEAEHLTAPMLDQLRRLNDSEFAGVGILLVGLPRLLSILKNELGDNKYLYSRVGWAFKVGQLSEKDIQEIVHKALPSSNGLWKSFSTASGRNTRTLCNLIERCVEVANYNNVAIDAELVGKTAKLLIV